MHRLMGLGGMLAMPQWFIWRLTWDATKGKYQKAPCYTDGSAYHMPAQDPTNWMTLDAAQSVLATLVAQQQEQRYTLGFYLTAATGYWFLDLDKCIDAAGVVSPAALSICQAFPGAAWEHSTSGRGLHVFGRGSVPPHGTMHNPLQLEFYTHGRGIAFGWGDVYGSIDTDHTAAVQWLVDSYFRPDVNSDGSTFDDALFNQPAPEWHGIEDDALLVTRMRASAKPDAGAVFAGQPSTRVTFADLFDCNVPALVRRWPEENVYGYDRSAAEAALIAMFAFWTGRDAARTERLMRTSAMQRVEWEDNRGGIPFIRYSIVRMFRKHVAGGGEVYGAGKPPASTSAPAPIVTMVGATVGDGPDYFAVVEGFVLELSGAANAQALFAVCERIKLVDIPRPLVERLVTEAKERFALFRTPQAADTLRRMMHYQKPRVVGATTGRMLTEFGNTMRLIDRYGAALMYVPVIDRWYRWNERHWQPAITEEIMYLAYETVMSISDEMHKSENEDERAALRKFFTDSQRMAMVSNIIKGATSRPEIVAPYPTLDAQLDLLGVANGAIDLRTGALMPPTREQRITMLAGPEYDPFATCPLFEQTVSDVFFGDAEMISFFRRLMGYTLMGRPKESILVIPYGSGANGKSTVLGAIQKALGGYARSVASDTFVAQEGRAGGNAGGPREDLLRLRGARYIYVSEIEENAQLKESLVKTLTGDDVIVARGINAKASAEFMPTFVPIMPTNHRPIIKGDDHGIWRRIMLLPFTRNFSEDKHVVKDLQRGAKLDAELPGILRWLVVGAMEYQMYGLCTPASVSAAHEEYREDMDVLGEWFNERCEKSDDFAESCTNLYSSWRSFAEQRGVLRLIPSQNALTRRLNSKGFAKKQHYKGIKGRCLAGLRLKNAFAA